MCWGFLYGCVQAVFYFNTWQFYSSLIFLIVLCCYFKPILNLLLAFIFAIFVVTIHFSLFYSYQFENTIDNGPAEITAKVAKVISNPPNSLSLIEIHELDGKSVPFYQTVHAQLSKDDDQYIFETGDLLVLKVKLRKFRSRMNRHSFDVEKYAFRNKLHFKGKVIEVIKHEKSSLELRQSYKQELVKVFENKNLGWLYYGLSTGDKSKVLAETKNQVIQLGIGHILAISGMHVGIVFLLCFSLAKIIVWFLLKIKANITLQGLNLNYFYCAFSLFIAFIYIYLCEFPVSALRAWFMAAIYSLIYFLHKKVSLPQTLTYTLSAILLIDPFSILDPGLFLSFVGFTTVVLVLKWTASNRLLSNSFLRLCLIQLSLMITLAPLSLMYFQGVSIAGLVVNLVLIPLLSFVIFPYLIACILLAGLFPNTDFLYVDDLLFFAFQYVTQNYLDVAWLAGPQLPSILVVLIYFCIAMLFSSFLRRFLLIPTITLASYFLVPRPLWQVDFFDVGHGTSVLVTSDKQAFLYDLGAKYFNYYSLFERVVLPEIKARDLNLKYTIISHPDKDHAGGIDELKQFDNFGSLAIFHNQQPFSFCQLKSISLGNVSIETIWPIDDMQSDNNNSCVVKLQGKGGSVLLTGDVEIDAEQRLVHEYDELLHSDILLVPHHGSKTSSSSSFLEAVKPTYGIVSRNYYSAWSLPHSEVIDRYASRQIKLIDTALSGQITIEFYQDGYHIKRLREENLFWLKHHTGF
ncbi:DNA internalization-related competence protein ComEC/Rec2 [Pseudoalteromonas phenolica]|uniref:DNA internalization-related competence protein ComEC/Rec2 n=1 Tax=Pseudoalteromonas phenolica TaxID=161398 RepID=UPI003850F1E6